MNLLAAAAFVVFVVGAILSFLVHDVGRDVILGLLFTGLACWVASSLFPNTRA